jgi:hypothetical protein
LVAALVRDFEMMSSPPFAAAFFFAAMELFEPPRRTILPVGER